MSIRATVLTFLISSFTVIVALGWNDFARESFKRIFGPESSLVSMVIYAIIVTIIGVVLSVYASK